MSTRRSVDTSTSTSSFPCVSTGRRNSTCVGLSRQYVDEDEEAHVDEERHMSKRRGARRRGEAHVDEDKEVHVEEHEEYIL